MGSLPVSAHRGRVPWQGLLLVASLVNFWCLPTTAQPGLLSKNAAEGEDVQLRVRNKPPNAVVITWYRGRRLDNTRIIAFLSERNGNHIRGPPDGPVAINKDGSLMLKNVTLRDAGIYVVEVELKNSQKLVGFGRLSVYKPVKVPTLVASNTTLTEDKDAVVLTCYTDVRPPQWLFNGTELQLAERMKLSDNHQSLTIDPVKREDAGNYQCKVSNPISSEESAPVFLDVKFE